jgi:hypothetical protein
MSDNRPGGKWAGEVYDFLRIFSRVNRSFYGLLLLQLGWLALLFLVSRVTPQTTEQPALPVPWAGDARIQVDALVLPGMAVLALLWLVFSRALLYAILPFRGVLRWCIRVLWYPGVFLSALVAVVLLP